MIDVDSLIKKGEKLADEIEVYVLNHEDLSLEQREMAVSSVFEHTGQSVYIRVIKDKKMGVSATSDTTRINDCLNAAVSSAKLSAEIPGWTGFAQKATIEKGKEPADSTLEITPDVAGEYLEQMNAGASKYPESRVVNGGVTLSRGSSIIANSNGVWLERSFTDIVLGMDAICEGSTGYDTDASPFKSRLNPEKIGENTAYFASASRNGKTVASGKYDVVFSEDVVDSLILELFTEAVNGKNVMTGQSIYADKLGETVASPTFSIIDDPMNPNGNAWRRFDTEGTPAKKTDIVKDGVLKIGNTNNFINEECVYMFSRYVDPAANYLEDFGYLNFPYGPSSNGRTSAYVAYDIIEYVCKMTDNEIEDIGRVIDFLYEPLDDQGGWKEKLRLYYHHEEDIAAVLDGVENANYNYEVQLEGLYDTYRDAAEKAFYGYSTANEAMASVTEAINIQIQDADIQLIDPSVIS